MANFWENDPIVAAPQGAAPWEHDQIVGQPSTPQPAPRPEWSDIPGNILPSGKNAAMGLYEAVRHPIDTINTLNDAAMGGVEKLRPDWLKEIGKTVAPNLQPSPETLQRQDTTANTMGDALMKRYGGLENIRNTVITDPVGSAIDVSVLSSGGAALAPKAGVTARSLAKTAELTNPVNLVAKPASAVVQTFKPMGRAPVLESELLKKLKTAAYAKVKKSGIVYKPEAINGLVKNIGRALDKGGLNVDRHPKTFSFVDDIERLNRNKLSLQQLDEFRQTVKRDISNTPDPSDARFGQLIIEKIDKFIDNTSPRMVVGAGTANARDILREARKANQVYRTTEMFETALDKGQRRAAVTGKGANEDNAMRQKVNSLIDEKNGRTFKMLPPDVQAKMLEVVKGTKTRNRARYVGSLAPTGIVSGGLGAGVGYGIGTALETMTGIPGLGQAGAVTIPAIGYAAKRIGDVGTSRAIDDLIRVVQNNGKKLGKGPRSKVNDQTLIKALIAGRSSSLEQAHR